MSAMSVQEQVTLGMRWKVCLGVYLFLYMLMFANQVVYLDWITRGAFYSKVTNILVTSVFLTVLGIAFSKTRNFTLKYVFLPTFGLMWVVFAIRLFFEIFAGTKWIALMTEGDSMSLNVIKVGDFVVHILTLFVGYQVLHVFRDSLEKQYETLCNGMKLFLAYLPWLLILLWHFFYDPYQTYMVPKNMATQSVFYLMPPILLTYTYTIFRVIVKPEEDLKNVLKVFRVLMLALMFAILGVGVYLFGTDNLYRSVISWVTILLIIILAMRLYSGSKMWFLTVSLFPVYALTMGVYFMREIIFSWLGASHQPFLDLIRPGVENGEMWYTIYMLLSYVCLAPLIGEIFIMEFPYNIKKDTLVKRAMLRQRHQMGKYAWIHELWNGYGAVLIIGAFLLFSGGANRYFPGEPVWEAAINTLLGMVVVCVLFSHMLYRRFLKRAEDL